MLGSSTEEQVQLKLGAIIGRLSSQEGARREEKRIIMVMYFENIAIYFVLFLFVSINCKGFVTVTFIVGAGKFPSVISDCQIDFFGAIFYANYPKK